MADRERMELLCSRYFDGDLTDGEEALLMEALERDPELKAFYEELEEIHRSVAKLAEQDKLPSGFTESIIDALPDDAPVFKLSDIGWRSVAAAAAVVLVLGLIVGASIINQPAGVTGVEPPLSAGTSSGSPEGAVESDDPTYEGPSVDVIAYSDGTLELDSPAGRVEQNRFQGKLAVPAQVKAPADTHAVIEAGGGTIVLSPGASARIGVDADGMADFEPIDGDLYMESKRSAVRSRVNDLDLSVNGGLTLRREGGDYIAEPSHGQSMIGGHAVGFRQSALISGGGVVLQDRQDGILADWAIDGRADAILHEVKTLLGDKFDQVPPEAWERSRKLLRGVLARPAEAATHAKALRFLLKHGFFEDSTPEEIQAWTTIADILAEGTTESDIPVQVLEMFENAERELERNPDLVRDFKRMIRESLERLAEMQKRHQQD